MKIENEKMMQFLLEDCLGKKIEFSEADAFALMDKVENCDYTNSSSGIVGYNNRIQTSLDKRNHPEKGWEYTFSIIFGTSVAYHRESSLRHMAIFRCIADWWKDILIQRMMDAKSKSKTRKSHG